MEWILAVALAACGAAAGEFPSEASLADAAYFPEAGGCRFGVCPTRGYFAYGSECRRIPPDPTRSAGSLFVVVTSVSAIRRGDLDSWNQLVSLALDMNPELEVLEDGAFAPLGSLTNLSISGNPKLSYLSPGAFTGLMSLRELRFIKNNVQSLFSLTTALRPFVLPRLKYLDLSDNPLPELSADDFAGMEGSKLEELALRLCGTYSIDPAAFSVFKELRALNLDNNKLSTETLSRLVVSLNRTAPKLRHLGIGSNFLNKNTYEFLSLVADTKLSSLDLKENHFEYFIPSLMEKSFFPFLPRIEELDLSSVFGYELHPWTFEEALPNLRRLVFTKNNLQGFLPALRLRNIVELDLSDNICESCEVKLHFEIEDYSLANMTSLQVLTLSNNYFYQVSKFKFWGLTSLRTLSLSNCSIFYIEQHSFENLTSLKHLDLSHNKLTKKESLPGKVFFGLDNLISLRLVSCDISGFSDPNIFTCVPRLEYLTLKDNKFAEMESVQFSNLPNVEVIDMSSNGILPWNERVFTHNAKLKELILNSNHIYKFTREMLDDLSGLEMLKLRDNPFLCNCDLARVFLDGGFEYSKSSFGISDRAVKCYTPKALGETRVAEFLETFSGGLECLPWLLIAPLAGSFLLLVVILLFAGAYFSRWYIRYWAFLLRQKWRSSFPGDRGTLSFGKFKYDAFVSYCNEDRNFVIRLVAMLENYDPHYRLCVYERDFKAGEVISQSVVDCLSSSRKSILVLTDAFARSQWCQWELQMAQHKRIFFRQEGREDSLILVKLGDVMEAHMTPTLRYLMKTRVYLEWHSDPKRQRIFWQKLRDALSPSITDIVSV